MNARHPARAIAASVLCLALGIFGRGIARAQTVVVELQPRADLQKYAAAVGDPSSPLYGRYLSREAFVALFGATDSQIEAAREQLRAHRARDIRVLSDRLMLTAQMSAASARTAFDKLPRGVRAVRGIDPRHPLFSDTAYTEFRAGWYTPSQFRQAYDAVPDGGRGQTVVLVEDASDGFRRADVEQFLSAKDAPPGASISNLQIVGNALATPTKACGKDDRGQEATIDVDAIFTLAPAARVVVRYEPICSGARSPELALADALEDGNPSVIVEPFVWMTLHGPSAQEFGVIPIPILEAAARGIPLVVPSGDDGPVMAYPCVLPYVFCAGGTSLGQRNGPWDEAPWNDGSHAGGGGISDDPRPSWQQVVGGFEFSPSEVPNRLVPDVSADAAGHLRVFWHDYGAGGIGGTSESAALVGAQLAAINSAVAAGRRLRSPASLYVLAKEAPQAFRDITGPNDRGYSDNSIRPRPSPLPLDYHGVVPPTPSPIVGCTQIQPDGCVVRKGYDAVTGIGSLLERAAISAINAVREQAGKPHQ